MPTVRGRAEVKRFLARLPGELERKVLRGAARAGAAVIADEARLRTQSDEVREKVVTRSRNTDGRVLVMITVVEGWARSVAIWEEWGTAPHFITVDDSQRAGRSAGRINRQIRNGDVDAASLVINGHFVGATVHHPGAKPHPFLRPALDTKEREAIAAAQSYITSRIRRSGVVGGDEPEGDDA